jgi:hypothetical protein
MVGSDVPALQASCPTTTKRPVCHPQRLVPQVSQSLRDLGVLPCGENDLSKKKVGFNSENYEFKAVGIGRGDRIRTYDPLRPRQVRYQAALRPDNYLECLMIIQAYAGTACGDRRSHPRALPDRRIISQR